MVMLPPVVASAAKDVRRELERQLPGRVGRVVVFGSTARGTANEDSDVDLLIVLDHLAVGERARIIDIAATIGFERDLRIVPLVISESAWAELESRELLLPREVARDGVIV